MEWIGNLSLGAKLRVIVVYAAAVAVLIVSVLHVSGEAVDLRRNLGGQLQALVVAVADNAAPALRTPKLARKLIGSLHADPDVRAATLYDIGGNVVARLEFAGGATDEVVAAESLAPVAARAADPAHPSAPSVRYDRLTGVRVLAPVLIDGIQVGTLQADAELTQLLTMLPGAAKYLGLGLLLAVVVAYILSIHLQRMISGPVHDLAQVARRVTESSESKRFAVRARKQANDEFGTLVDGFNGMLSELERRDLNLRMYQNELEQRVRERTVSLDSAVAEAQEARERAEAASRAKSEFLAQHEPRDPHADERRASAWPSLLLRRPARRRASAACAETIHQSRRARCSTSSTTSSTSPRSRPASWNSRPCRFDLRESSRTRSTSWPTRAHRRGWSCSATSTAAARHRVQRRRRPAAADPHQPGQQRDQVHRARRSRGHGAPAEDRTTAQLGLALRGHGHRHRHPAREASAALRGLRAGRRLDHAPVRRHGTGPRHLQAAGRTDGRTDRRQQRARRGSTFCSSRL